VKAIAVLRICSKAFFFTSIFDLLPRLNGSRVINTTMLINFQEMPLVALLPNFANFGPTKPKMVIGQSSVSFIRTHLEAVEYIVIFR